MGIPPSPRGVPQIEVTFAIDSNGIVNVSARDMATNLTQSIQINPAGGLSEDEVAAPGRRGRQQLPERRRAARDRASSRTASKGLIYSNERVFEQFRDMLQEAGREEDPRERC